MGKSAAAITGITEWKPSRVWDRPMFALEAAAQLAAEALADAGLGLDQVDGILIPGLPESPLFAPSALAEYLGLRSNFNEVVDLGGASACGMVWRAAAAIEVGVCDTALVMPCFGGGACVVQRAEQARRGPRRPVRVSGSGEHLTHKTWPSRLH